MIGRGTTVVAAKPGTILTKRNTTAACTGALGGYPTIQIKGDDGNYYFYAHFEPGKVTAKNRGDHVDAGERLGEVGYDKCGQSSSHLHIQMYTSVINGNAQSMNIQPGLVKAFEALPE
jgi:murein DD-endopeptidase MepM/ murein hydrolase activator NlpD